MTEVSKMTDAALNRALAVLVGYTSLTTCWDPYHQQFGPIPQYCTDPAASLEVQKAACEAAPAEYLQALQEILYGNVSYEAHMYRIADMMNAIPRQKAEAAYMTLRGIKRGN